MARRGMMRHYNTGGKILRLADGSAAPVQPGVDTGIAAGGQARGSIDNYFQGPQWGQASGQGGYNNDLYGSAATGQGVQGKNLQQTIWQPPTPQPVAQPAAQPAAAATNSSSGNGAANAAAAYQQQQQQNQQAQLDTLGDTGGSFGLGLGSTGGIDVNSTGNEGAWLNIPSFTQEAQRETASNAEHGFTTDTVNDAYYDLQETNPELVAQPFTAAASVDGDVTSTTDEYGNVVNTGGAADVQHEALAENQANYTNILQNQEALGLSNAEVAALNPAYNAEAQAAHADNTVGVGTWGPGGILGTTKRADNLLSSDFANVSGGEYIPNVDAAGNIDSSTGGFTGGGIGEATGGTVNTNANDSSIGSISYDPNSNYAQNASKQYGLAGASAAAAGIRNIGGASAQNGTNSGLPMDYQVVSSSDGTSEVWGPNGTTYATVEEAQAAAGVPPVQPAWEGPGIAQTAAGAVTAERGQAEGRALAAQAAAAEQQEIASNAGLSTEQLANLSPIEQLNAKYGNIDTSYAQAAAGDDESHGAIRGNLTRQGLTSAEADQVLAAAKGSNSDFFASTPAATNLVGTANSGPLGPNAATTAASAQGSDIISGTGGQSRAQVNAGHQALLQSQGLGDTTSSQSQARQDNATAAAQQTSKAEIANYQQQAQAQLAAGVPAAQVRAQAPAEPAAVAAIRAEKPNDSWSGAEKNEFYQQQKNKLADYGYNSGGPVGYNQGGGISSNEEERKRRAQAQAKIAQSQVQQQQFQKKAPLQPGQAGGGGGGALAGIGSKLLKTGLGAALGPLGGILGGLFNDGGQIPMQHLNKGGWLSALWGGGKDEPQQLNALGRPINKQARTQTSLQQRQSKPRPQRESTAGTNDHTRGWADTRKSIFGFNNGGMLAGPLTNPNGYNAGGMAQETPIKKVMEEDKIAMAREAFEFAEARKDEKFAMEETRASEKHQMDMKMKKQAATTKTAPLAAR